MKDVEKHKRYLHPFYTDEQIDAQQKAVREFRNVMQSIGEPAAQALVKVNEVLLKSLAVLS